MFMFDIRLPGIKLTTCTCMLLFEVLQNRQSQYSHAVAGVFMIRQEWYFPIREKSM